MNIGSLKLENQIFLAPMAGVCDLPFRLLCREQGCALVYSEMVSAKGLYYNNENTKCMLEIHQAERPIALQLFGSEPDILAEMAKKIEEYPIDIIDINMGCPAPKIVKNGDGSALMKTPKKIGEIVKAVSLSVKKPVTVKIRKGFNDNSINAVEVAKIIEDNGAAAIAIHGRTREQYYSGEADWDIIKKVKQSVNIPIIGNGDINSPQKAKQMLSYTGCDAVMIGRAAQGNPWIFSSTIHYLKTGILLPEPKAEEKINMAIRHLKMLINFKGEYIAIREMRKHIAWYTKGIEHSSELRVKINLVENLKQVIELLNLYK